MQGPPPDWFRDILKRQVEDEYDPDAPFEFLTFRGKRITWDNFRPSFANVILTNIKEEGDTP